MPLDLTVALFDAVRAYAAAYRPGHAPRRVVIVYDDGQKDGRPIPPCVCVPPDAARLTAMEENVLDALAGGLTLTGQQIADATGYSLDKDLKACLAAMRRRGVLTGARGDVGYAAAAPARADS
jgi:hypothetical protein